MKKEQAGPASVSGEPDGRYSNFFKAGFNAFEFLLEYGYDYAGVTEMRLHTRIITAPAYAKAFESVLHSAIQEYERIHGPIREENE